MQKRLEVAPSSFYAVRVAPLFEAYCIGCHGVRRQKGQLRLDSLAAAMRGGKHGPVIRTGKVQDSELISRMMLPASNEKAMPPQGKPPLSVDDVEVIKLWVAAGASGVQPVGEFKNAPRPVVQVKFPEIDTAAVERERAPLSALVKRLQTRFPGVLAYESRDSASLEVYASLQGASFGDAELAAFAPLADRILWADFSNTAITDASASTLIAMNHLRVLRLVNTRVTDESLASLQKKEMGLR